MYLEQVSLDLPIFGSHSCLEIDECPSMIGRLVISGANHLFDCCTADAVFEQSIQEPPCHGHDIAIGEVDAQCCSK